MSKYTEVYIPSDQYSTINQLSIDLIQYICEKYELEHKWNDDFVEYIQDRFDIDLDMADPKAFKVFLKNSDWSNCIHASEYNALEAIGKLHIDVYGKGEYRRLEQAFKLLEKEFWDVLKKVKEEHLDGK